MVWRLCIKNQLKCYICHEVPSHESGLNTNCAANAKTEWAREADKVEKKTQQAKHQIK